MQYQLFLKATQLDVIIERLNDCVETLKSSKIKSRTQMQSHEKLVKQQEEIDQKIEQFRSMEPLRVCSIIFVLLSSSNIFSAFFGVI